MTIRTQDEQAEFTARAEPYRRELRIHCYRMLGSFDEAEDQVQETFLRAWRARDSFKGRSTFRAWMYRIATNACLDALGRRPVPADPADIPWLQPYPDRLLPSEDEPDAVVVARETIELAFLAAVQVVPPRQRAVLILRDVLGWPAKDAAELLETSVASVNSALQRARATLRDHLPERRLDWSGGERSEQERALVRRYVEASERGDTRALALMLRDDARFSMPPEPGLFVGREAIFDCWTEGGFGTRRVRRHPLPRHGSQPPAGGGLLRAQARRRCVPAVRARRAADRGRPDHRDHRLPGLGRVRAAAGLVMLDYRVVELPPGGERPYDAAEWAGALVIVDRGDIELACSDGRRPRFAGGAVLWLAGLPVRELRNPGSVPAVLVAVRRAPALNP